MTVYPTRPTSCQVCPYEFDHQKWLENKEQTLSIMLLPEDMQWVKRQDENIFDRSLWEMNAAENNPQYATQVYEKLQPGYLWVQYGLQGAIIHWSTPEDNTIHRASLLEDKVLILSYKRKNFPAVISSHTSLSQFQQHIHSYLVNARQTDWGKYQEKLKLIYIHLRVSKAAMAQLNTLPTGPRIAFCLKPSVDSVALSKNTSLMTLTKFTYSGPSKKNMGKLPLHVRVKNLSNLKGPCNLRIRSLIPRLIVNDGGKNKFKPFKRMTTTTSDKENVGYKLNIDFQESKWVLRSEYTRLARESKPLQVVCD